MAYLIFENNNMKFYTVDDPTSDTSIIKLNEKSVVKEVADDLDIETKTYTLVNNKIVVKDLELPETYDIDMLRHERNEKLKETDLWGLQDFPATSDQLKYRQDLRDITKTYTSLSDVVWPTKP